MTGKINFVNSADSSGVIVADNGIRVHFNSSDLFAYDIGRIMVGQIVTFELKSSRPLEAANVCPQRAGAPRSANESPLLPSRGETRCRYAGFEQNGSQRSYKFELTLSGDTAQTISFQIDLGLLRLHSIAIQDGPALCRHALTARGIESSPALPKDKDILLGERDVAAYRASLPALNTKRKYGFRKAAPALA